MATTVPAPADNPRPDATLTHFRLGMEAARHLAAYRARLDTLADQFTARAVTAALTANQAAR